MVRRQNIEVVVFLPLAQHSPGASLSSSLTRHPRCSSCGVMYGRKANIHRYKQQVALCWFWNTSWALHDPIKRKLNDKARVCTIIQFRNCWLGGVTHTVDLEHLTFWLVDERSPHERTWSDALYGCYIRLLINNTGLLWLNLRLWPFITYRSDSQPMSRNWTLLTVVTWIVLTEGSQKEDTSRGQHHCTWTQHTQWSNQSKS